MKLKHTYGYLCSKMYLELILMAIWAIVSAFILGWKYWYMYPIFCLSGIFIYSLLFAFISKIWELLYYRRLSLEDKLDLVNSELHKMSSLFCETDFMGDISEIIEDELKEERDIIKQAMKNFEAKKEVLETPEVIQDVELSSFYKENELFEKSFHKFILNQSDKNKELSRTLFQDIKSKTNTVFSLIAERESLRSFVNKIFNVYMPEIVILINEVPNNKKAEYEQNISKVVNELNVLLDKTLYAIKEVRDRNAEVTFDLLVKEMKREGDEIDGRR